MAATFTLVSTIYLLESIVVLKILENTLIDKIEGKLFPIFRKIILKTLLKKNKISEKEYNIIEERFEKHKDKDETTSGKILKLN